MVAEVLALFGLCAFAARSFTGSDVVAVIIAAEADEDIYLWLILKEFLPYWCSGRNISIAAAVGDGDDKVSKKISKPNLQRCNNNNLTNTNINTNTNNQSGNFVMTWKYFLLGQTRI